MYIDVLQEPSKCNIRSINTIPSTYKSSEERVINVFLISTAHNLNLKIIAEYRLRIIRNYHSFLTNSHDDILLAYTKN